MRARLKMKNINLLFVCLCLLFTSSFGDGSKQEKDNNSEEIIGEQDSKQTKCQENDEKDCDIDYMNSNETGPLDSHEAMNTREFKARNKRSIEVDKKAFRNMLLGRVHKKSEDMREEAAEIDAEPQKGDASELLLELLVRIATHPQQWNEVHTLLQKIDNDIVTSKKIITDLEKPQESTIGSNTITTGMDKIENITQRTSSTTDDVQKLIILLDNEKQNNYSRSSWPNLNHSNTNSSEELEEEETYQHLERLSKDQTATTQNMFSWANKPSVKNTTRDFEFSYHRVTGQPLPYRSNYDKARARNAYIAVSVIGAKSRDMPLEKQDHLLEDELRQLKPWNREENFSNMENIPSKWIFQSHLHKNSNAQSP